MYCQTNFKTKKELKEAVAARLAGNGKHVDLGIYNPGPFGNAPRDGIAFVEGPHYQKPHTWYATVVMKEGVIVHVK